jgi:hypothetical protein
MRGRLKDITVGAVVLLLGAIVGAIVEKELNGGFSASLLAVLVLCLAVIAAVTLAVWSSDDLARRIQNVLRSTTAIEKRLGLEVTYQDLRDIGDPKKPAEDILAGIIRQAKMEILEVTRSDVHTQAHNADLPPSPLRKAYYDSILERVRTQSATGVEFSYKQIIQFSDGAMDLHLLGDSIFVDHCRGMLALQAHEGTHTYVKKTSLTFPTAFLLIDREYLVLTIDSVRTTNSKIETHQKAEIVIKDPQQELIKVFLKEWEKIENSPATRAVSASDL